MTAGRPAGGGNWRPLAAGLLVVANLVLVGLNLAKHDVVTLSFGDDDDTAVNSATAGSGDQASGETEATTAAPTSLVEGDTDATAPPATEATTTPTVDDWPGGRGPVPDGPPEPRRALVSGDGRMVLTGSAPDWATATKVIQYAGEKMPGGSAVVDNQLTWHPDANPSTQWGDVVMENAATFAAGTSDIDPASLTGLGVVVDLLTSHPTVFAVVIGHADSQGDEAVNAQLAADRAAAVVDYLVGQGVIPGQIVVASAGEDDPMASNDTEEGRAVNRRAEIQFKNVLTPQLGTGS